MKGYNPFAKFSKEYTKEILKAGRLNGVPITSKQRYHLQRVLSDRGRNNSHVQKLHCNHPKEARMITSFGQKYCKKCQRNI